MYIAVVLLLLGLPLATPTCPPNQITLPAYLLSHRPFLVDLLCRGFPVHISLPLYRNYLTSLVSHLASTSPDSPLESLCVTVPGFSQNSLINIPSLNKQLETLLSDNPTLPYLPVSDYPHLPPLPPRVLHSLNNLAQEAISTMQHATPASLKCGKLVEFPPPLSYLYDPFHKNVCSHYQSITPDDVQTVPAPDLLHQIVALVLQLHLLTIPPRDSLPLLYHNLAFTFLAIRCTKTEASNLHLPLIFMPWYQQAFSALVANLPHRTVDAITPALIQETLASKLELFSTHAAWGQPSLITVQDGVTRRVHIADIIFDPKAVGSIRMHLDGTQQHFPTVRVTFPHLAVRLSCSRGLYQYSSHPRVPKPVCCPELCRQASLLAKVGWSTQTCCLEYLRDSGSLLRGPLRDVATIYLEPYRPGSSGVSKVKI